MNPEDDHDLQHRFVKTLISDQLLELGVFLFEILELATLVGLDPAALYPPSVAGLLGNTELASNLWWDPQSLPEIQLCLSELVDDLLC